MENMKPRNYGYCVICEKDTEFIEENPWLRDHYLCTSCKSIPRQRALINTLNEFYPEWKTMDIYESSPCGPASKFLKTKNDQYVSSHLFSEDLPSGSYVKGIRNENLERMSFGDVSFDLVITQDVFEHVMEPDKAFNEISRILRPGGAHVFTMPWYSDLEKTRRRAKKMNGEIIYLEEPQYHGNPVDAKGSLVTFDWGRDFTDFIFEHSNMQTLIYLVKDKYLGLDAEFLHVFVSRKKET
ncbi:class I SAM-dependent methyltransferase [Paenibacillus sp. MBLB2552]|uniref:Class I SAM-dependent methyltransferase n=1 Tax=Paenibacillus mellifer TaxID=2937794 RepID=A0A9X1Y166_9BACL|nr:class I SAM-dependent methyltransferase [Paenibacillus mellifer]MCK8489039.1 class I SAM-dependent methyltransferase [Paenibacillus mellifer]